MSVAFRRESDEEHKEPVFEQPIAPGPNLVTGRGLRLIAERIAALEAEIARAEDPRRQVLKRDLRYWETRQTTAEVVAPREDGAVGVGSTATIRIGGRERAVTIVGGDEADPAAGLIGYQAPLARALIGAYVGDDVEFGEATVELLRVGVREED